ncbi:MAG TPA: ATP-binding protein [Candidatus Absconditabacterales bacterium]|nr:ATP-binding protein [Candidatus Absconditabacterales bacterium]
MTTNINKVFDTNYTNFVKGGGYPFLAAETPTNTEQKSRLDRLVAWIFGTPNQTKQTTKQSDPKDFKGALDLKDQIKKMLELPDKDYSDKLLTSELRRYIQATEKSFHSSMSDIKTHIAPSYREIKGNQFNVSGMTGKTYYANNYPSYIDMLWTRDILSFHSKRDMSFFIYPEEDSAIQTMLKNKATQLKAEINEAASKRITIDTELEVQYRDVEMIRQKLATREERYFESGFYMSLYNPEADKLVEEGKKFEQKISGYGIKIKAANQRMDEGMNCNVPLCIDDLGITRSMVTSSLAGSFPFISSDIISKTGILYGLNMQTGALVVFDRFNNKLPNMNSVVLATSGAGKSFTVKLEILRYLIQGIQVMVIDPENEYKALTEKVGGTYVNIATNSDQHINPFDIPPKIEDIEYGKGDLLRSQISGLLGMIGILVGGLTPESEALLDKALQNTYALKGITIDSDDYTGKKPPIMEDLLNVLEGMEGGENLAIRLSKYVTGTFAKVFNNQTNIDLSAQFTVFSIRDLEEALKTPAMYNVLNFIRTKIRSQKTQRLLVVDEAWIMLQNEISANFLFGLIKRARKYGLGITTISQDIEDFVKSKYGKPIVSNSAVQILLKQSTTSIKSLSSILGLTETEKQTLVSANIGEGLLFAGSQHVAVKIMASPEEKDFITTNITAT